MNKSNVTNSRDILVRSTDTGKRYGNQLNMRCGEGRLSRKAISAAYTLFIISAIQYVYSIAEILDISDVCIYT